MALGSFRKFEADDYLMMLALCFYTSLISTINIVRHTSSNLFPPGYDVAHLTAADRSEREYGSKLILVVEQSQCATIWLVKGCLVLLYLRLTSVHREHLAIKILGAYVVVTFVVMDILYFGVWCQPFHEYWAVPTDSTQCNAATNHLITNACFNLSSDVAMLVIVLPIFLRMRLPWRKKIPLTALFSLGLFTILAAILNKVYSFSDPFGSLWTYWYTRESSTSLLVANLPFVWTLWARIPGVKVLVGVPKHSSQMAHFADEPADTIRQGSIAKMKKNEDNVFARDSGDDQELNDFGIDASLADMLREQNPASVSEKAPTEITHPHLFYGRRRTVDETSDSPLDKAVLSESPEHSIVRYKSSFDDLPDFTQDTLARPSMASKKSAGSFV